MPTHSDISPHLPSTAPNATPSTRPTCPPEPDRITSWIESAEGRIAAPADNDSSAAQSSLGRENAAEEEAPQPARVPDSISVSAVDNGSSAAQAALERENVVSTSVGDAGNAGEAQIMAAASTTAEEAQSPASESTTTDEYDETDEPMSPSTSVSAATEIKDEQRDPPTPVTHLDTPVSHRRSMSYEFSEARLIPDHSSSYFRSGSKFTGTQQSDQQIYTVDVEIKNVDMSESYLCGYLKIKGLTPDHPTLTTFFEGEIIGTKHTFQTRHEDWGATEKTDMHHWSRFPAWRPLAKLAKKPDFTYKDYAQRENIFMRWKEAFLVPDHRVKTISGASFEGFYYICFNQVQGTISGIYFHAKSEK
ncbi:vacuolar import and degradation protein 24 [Arthroderma uncinatum]|uniref:vacuolar import and degradation protein 24 n=1 Tax=Arthroderma uncinatum TaxID=74035 RepID=UPI00144A6AA7|nr:vacuolar import and degradation protein 24 [Arthroderma uncinatum]KAF3480154.1 vacuolar import and degradation protein 24 [Arthroderma uncinatum]